MSGDRYQNLELSWLHRYTNNYSRGVVQLSSERDAWRWRGAYLQQWDECVSRWLDERPGLSNLTDNPTAVRARVRARILAGLVLSWMFRLQYPP